MNFPEDRPVGYDPEAIYDFVTGLCNGGNDILIRGGGRYRQTFIAFSYDANSIGKIMFGNL